MSFNSDNPVLFGNFLFDLKEFEDSKIQIKAQWWDKLLIFLSKLGEKDDLKNKNGLDVFCKIIPKIMIDELLLFRFEHENFLKSLKNRLKILINELENKD